jgi:hypothetical protein
MMLRLLLLVASLSSSDAVLDNIKGHSQALFDWIQSAHKNGGGGGGGGFVADDKIEIRRVFPDLENSSLGVFAKQNIPTNETILRIPRHFYFDLSEEKEHYSNLTNAKTMERYFTITCELAKKLIKELSQYEREDPESSSSEYNPYLAYIASQQRGQIPATYSKLGKELLRKLSGSGSSSKDAASARIKIGDDYAMPPWELVDWIDEHFVQTGCIAEGDDQAYHAVSLVVQRGYDHELIPVWDMFNHHNGKLNLETNSLRSKEGLIVWAAKDIQAGEELYATYNYCHDCLAVGDNWGTPGIFRDFGFVEDYPQTWPFWDQNFFFEVYLDEETGETEAEFEEDEKTGQPIYVPDENGLAYLQSEWNRVANFNVGDELEGMGATKEDLPPHEYQNIKRYHESLEDAFEVAIDATLEMRNQNPSSNEEL